MARNATAARIRRISVPAQPRQSGWFRRTSIRQRIIPKPSAWWSALVAVATFGLLLLVAHLANR